MKLPSFIFPLLLLAVIYLIASPSHLNAQTVTWGATGLPPGMTVTNSGTNAVKITGTPTTPGSYNAIIFPKIGSIVGDMMTIPITVLPNGVNLPVYYGYNRLSSSNSGFSPLAGGNGFIFGWDNSGSPLFTTNGTAFTKQSLPAGVNPFGNNYVQGAIAGTRYLLCGNGVMAYSDKQGAFKTLSFPTGISDQQSYNSGVGANGTNRFFYAFTTNTSTWNGTSWTYSYSIQLYSMQNNQTNWTPRGTFNLPSSVSSFSQPSISVAVNGSFVMAIQGNNTTSSLLLRSTNGGDTWIVNNANPGIQSVAYGNGIFLGTGYGGVWKSSNGINWTQTSTTYVGNIIYSAPEGCFFSSGYGVSKDGVFWMNYGPGTPFNAVGYEWPVSSGTGILFVPGAGNGLQLSTTYIPSFYASNPHLLNVGTATSFTLQLDSAGSGSISQ